MRERAVKESKVSEFISTFLTAINELRSEFMRERVHALVNYE